MVHLSKVGGGGGPLGGPDHAHTESIGTSKNLVGSTQKLGGRDPPVVAPLPGAAPGYLVRGGKS